MTDWPLVFTCEHGGNRVPAALRPLFPPTDAVFASHRGWDPGALAIAQALARRFSAPLVCATVSRLVVDPNRSAENPGLFSKWTGALPARARRDILERYWQPHREAVDAALDAMTRERGRVVHLGLHSFTPVLRGERRPLEIGLLYDPRRPTERAVARALQARISAIEPGWRVRMNQPYRGTDDGLTTAERRRRADAEYAGVEIEVNQKLARRPEGRARVVRALTAALVAAPPLDVGPRRPPRASPVDGT